MIAENTLTAATCHTNSCYLTMVATDESGRPTAVAPLLPQTDLERQRFGAAVERRRRSIHAS